MSAWSHARWVVGTLIDDSMFGEAKLLEPVGTEDI